MEFIRSGERQRLGELVAKRLKETGWVSEVETLCRKYVTEHGIENLKYEDMIDDVKDRARRTVPEEVKKELMDLIRQFVDDHLGLTEK
uniref:Transcription and mRNA export factor ENY2 n=1 Tax=Acrobeloides nanus TaxID=290746 RepID=A0A914DEW0_9BILA